MFNVCTGQSISAADQVRLVRELIDPIEVEHVVDPERVRAHEVMDLRGSHDRLTAATGWEPEIPIRQTMADTIEWWKRELTSTGARGSASISPRRASRFSSSQLPPVAAPPISIAGAVRHWSGSPAQLNWQST